MKITDVTCLNNHFQTIFITFFQTLKGKATECKIAVKRHLKILKNAPLEKLV